MQADSIQSESRSSGDWASGQQYDYNGLNNCHSTNHESGSTNFVAQVIDEKSTEIGRVEKKLNENQYLEVTNSGFIGSKECKIYTNSTNHTAGFNA